MSCFQCFIKYVVIGGGVVLLFVGVVYFVGVKVNIIKSILVGLYWKLNVLVEKGVYVMFCLL